MPIEVVKRSGYFNLPGDTTPVNLTLLSQYMDPSTIPEDLAANTANPNGRPGNMTMRANARQQNANFGGSSEMGADANRTPLPASLPFTPGNANFTPTGGHFDKMLAPESSRSSRRIVVSGYKEQGFYVKPEEVADFFTETLGSIRLLFPLKGNESSDAGLVVASHQASPDGQSVVLEFWTPELATLARTFDGAFFKELDDQWRMEVRRPADYVTPIPTSADIKQNKIDSDKDIEEEEKQFKMRQAENGEEQTKPEDGEQEVFEEKLKTVSSRILDSKNKIYIAEIPFNVNKSQIFELLQALGELSGLQVIYDMNGPADETRGIAFAEFKDTSVTDRVIEEIKQLKLGDSYLRAGHASSGQDAPLASITMRINPMVSLVGAINTYEAQNGPMGGRRQPDTRVLMLLNMVSIEDLTDDQEYQEIVQDISEECGKYGTVEDVLVPRPDSSLVNMSNGLMLPGSSSNGGVFSGPGVKPGVKTLENTGVGKVYVKFATKDACQEAFEKLGGRKFADRTVISSFFPESNFDLRIF